MSNPFSCLWTVLRLIKGVYLFKGLLEEDGLQYGVQLFSHILQQTGIAKLKVENRNESQTLYMYHCIR